MSDKTVVGRLAKRPYQDGDPLPAVESMCLVSEANCDVESDQHRAYGWRKVLGYSDGNQFVCMQTQDCWPTVERLSNCWFAEIPTPMHPAPWTPNEPVAATIETMRSLLNRGQPLYCNEIRLPAEAAKALVDEFEQVCRERDYYIAAHGRACQESREALSRETAALRRSPENTVINATGSGLLMELFNSMPVKALAEVPADVADRIGNFMVANGYRIVFNRWYLQAEPREPERSSVKKSALPTESEIADAASLAKARADGTAEKGVDDLLETLGDGEAAR